MQLDEFLHNLHFNPDKVRPVDLAVDWDDAPLPYKLYQDLPVVELSGDVPLSLRSPRSRRTTQPMLKEIGDFFWYSYGLTQLCNSVYPVGDGEERIDTMQMLRRYVPSGGALYPTELYAYLKIAGLVPGVYHYDVAHHRLVLLREGDFDQYLARALGHRCDVSTCFGMLFVSTMFWKNFYKYNNFAYRLQGLDAGALMGQLLEVAKQYGFTSCVFFQFLDRAINHLLGLSDQEETVYAVIPLSLDQGTNSILHPTLNDRNEVEDAQTLCRELATLHHRHHVKSRNIASYSTLIEVNEVSMLHSTESFTRMPKSEAATVDHDGTAIVLPKVYPLDYDFASACRRRYSPGLDFVPQQISLVGYSTLLWETISSFQYLNDLDLISEECEPRVTLAGCVHGVDGLKDGAYIYDSRAHALKLLGEGDHRMRLQQGMSMPTVNLFQVLLCLHVVGASDFYRGVLGYRGHRIQQMEAGMLLQRLLLSASAIGMGGHPSLGYDEGECDDIYGFAEAGKTCLIQVPVGLYRKAFRFEGALYGS